MLAVLNFPVVPFLQTEDANSPGDRPAGSASLAAVRWCRLTARALAVTGKRSTVAITQHSERVMDFTVNMRRTPLKFPVSGR